MRHIPERVERAIASAVVHHLEVELGDRGLLLAADRQSSVAAEEAQRGKRLLTRVVRLCYPTAGRSGEDLVIEFESEATAERLTGALAFGAATATVLAPAERDPLPPAESVELLCAVFTLGIGLVDGVCDADPEAGAWLLRLVQERDLAEAAQERRPRGWLRTVLPAALGPDPTIAFTVEIIEAFFETLHAVYPGDAWSSLRCGVGGQLDAALDAERRSVEWSVDQPTRDRLIECSRLTSVLPFEIVDSLAGGAYPLTMAAAGTLLGEAMWRIDDLVDLCQDACSGALNGILLAHCEEHERRDRDREPVRALERVLASTDIARAAADAAESLSAGLQLAGGDHPTADGPLRAAQFLSFIQRYAGLPPGPRG